MARLRKFAAYRSMERPYTRISNQRKKSYIRMTHNTKIIRFEMGNVKKNFEYTLFLRTKSRLQIRDNAMESARTTSNRVLEGALGKTGFYLRIRSYPHHILRENPVASGAGADRFSTGMQKAFGKPIGQAIQLKADQIIFELRIDKNNLKLGRTALKRAASKLPCSTRIEMIENKIAA
ncbi:MAG: 50S ribosomal protein L16 [Nanoarchaeota archaeon]